LNLQPLNDRILVRVDEPEKRVGSIYLPDPAQEKSNKGTVLAVGPGKLNDDGGRRIPQVRVGDRVLFRTYPVDSIADDEGGMLAMSEENVIAKIIEITTPVDLQPIRFDTDFQARGVSTWEADAAAVIDAEKVKAPELGVVEPTQNTPTVNHPLASTSNLDASLDKYARAMSERNRPQGTSESTAK